MMATDPKSMWVRSDDNECHVRFRIEKVSRRKDGQRFKVLFEVDDSGECPDEFKHMKPVLTEPICVMSKRKAHAVGGRGRTRRRGAPDGAGSLPPLPGAASPPDPASPLRQTSSPPWTLR